MKNRRNELTKYNNDHKVASSVLTTSSVSSLSLHPSSSWPSSSAFYHACIVSFSFFIAIFVIVILLKFAVFVYPILYVFLIAKLKLLLGFHIEPVSLVNCFVYLQEFKKCPECGEKVKRKHLTRLVLHAGPDYHGV